MGGGPLSMFGRSLFQIIKAAMAAATEAMSAVGSRTLRSARQQFLLNVEGSDDSDDDELLINFKRRPDTETSSSVVSSRRPPEGRQGPARGSSSTRASLKRSAASPNSASTSVTAATVASNAKRSRVNGRGKQGKHHEMVERNEVPDSQPTRASLEQMSVSEVLRPTSVRLSDIFSEMGSAESGREFTPTDWPQVFRSSMTASSQSPSSDLQADTGSSSYDSPRAGSGSSEVQEGMEALDIDSQHPDSMEADQEQSSDSDYIASRTRALREMDRSFELIFRDILGSGSDSNRSSPEFGRRNWELDEIDGIPLRGSTEPRQGGLRRSGSAPADRSRGSSPSPWPSSRLSLHRNSASRAGSSDGFDVQVMLDRIDGVPLSGGTEPRSGPSLTNRRASDGSPVFVDLTENTSENPGTSQDNEIEVIGMVSASPETMARIHQLELDEALARRLQEEEENRINQPASPDTSSNDSPIAFIRRRPVRRGISRDNGSGMRVILPRLEQISDFVTTFIDSDDVATGSEPNEGGANSAATSTGVGRRTRASTALMDLVERIGDAGPSGMARREINRLPTVKYTGLEESDQSSCTICMSDYVIQEKLRRLPCTHTFHTGCVDRWLELLSGIFHHPVSRPINATVESDLVSRSHRVMLELGLIERAGRGFYYILPVALRSLMKLMKLVEDEMDKIGGQQLLCPSVGSKSIWLKSQRWDTMGNDMFKFRDRLQNELCLSPTHEESVTNLVSMVLPRLTGKRFPLYLYQISEKHRDELNPRFGLLRSRSFLMKDLYSFDLDLESANKSYQLLVQSYRNIFGNLGLEYVFVVADTGKMGGSLSHEFHVQNPAGQDRIYFCETCQQGKNSELVQKISSADFRCETCGHVFKELRTVEVAHTFLLGDKYSSVFELFSFTPYSTVDKSSFLQMGCYGIGLTRLLAASIDFLSGNKGSEIRWPISIAPYKVMVIPPKKGSKESGGTEFVYDFANYLSTGFDFLKNDVIIDDRSNLTVGRRLFEARQMGYPFVIVGAKTLDIDKVPKFEVMYLNKNITELLTHKDTVAFLKESIYTP